MYLKFGRKAVYYKPMDGDASGSGGSLDPVSAGAALASYFGGEQGQNESAEHEEKKDETPEAAAERLAADEAGANHEAAADGESTEQAEPEAKTFTIKVDGKDVQLSEAELAEAYKSGLRQADYTKKTTEAAEVRKTADAEVQKARQERDQYAQNLQQLLAVNQYQDQQEQQWTREMIDADPIAFLQAKEDREDRARKTQAAQAELQRLGQQQQQEQAQAAQAHHAQQLEAVQAKLPAWKDNAVMKQEVGEIKSWLFGQGFTESDLPGMQDHRIVLMARAAMKHEQLLSRAKETAQKVAKAPPKVEAPGRQIVAPTDGRTTGMQKLAKSGRIDDAASLLAQMFSK